MENKPVMSTVGGLTISEETKKTMTDLQDSAKALSQPKKDTIIPIDSTNPTELVGGIYDMMLKQRILELERRKQELDLKIQDKLEQDQLHKLIIDSLGEEEVEKAEKAKKKPKKPKKETGASIAEAGLGTAVMAGAVQEKTREEAQIATPAPTPTTTAPPAPSTEPKVTPVKEPTAKVEKISGMDDVKKMVIRHEGVRNEPYKDSRGLWTIGVGHLIGDGKTLPPEWNRKLSNQEVNDLFEKDFAHHVKIAEQTPGYSKANDGGKAAMIDLAFNMGKWWPKWPNTSKKLQEGDFQSASDNLKESKWYDQVKGRAKEIVALISQAGDGNGNSMVTNIPPSPSSGTQVAAASEANKDLKDTMKRDKQAAIVAKSQSTSVSQTQAAVEQKKEFDDRSAWQKKTQVA